MRCFRGGRKDCVHEQQQTTSRWKHGKSPRKSQTLLRTFERRRNAINWWSDVLQGPAWDDNDNDNDTLR